MLLIRGVLRSLMSHIGRTREVTMLDDHSSEKNAQLYFPSILRGCGGSTLKSHKVRFHGLLKNLVLLSMALSRAERPFLLVLGGFLTYVANINF